MQIVSTFSEIFSDGVRKGEIRDVDPLLVSIVMIEAMEGLIIVEEFIDKSFEDVSANDIIKMFLDGLWIQGD